MMLLLLLLLFGAGIWNFSWGNEAWDRCPWRNIRFITWIIGLVSSIQSLAPCCVTAVCLSLYREISHGWIFCFLSCETRFSSRFLIACSWFSILDSRRNRESRIESRIETRNRLSTFFWTVLYNATFLLSWYIYDGIKYLGCVLALPCNFCSWVISKS